MKKQDKLINTLGELLKEFKNAQVENFRYTRVTQGTVVVNWLRLHGDDRATKNLKRAYMDQFRGMFYTFSWLRRQARKSA